ncbi:MAG: peptide chain release factor N(5)-glutamine methyltransferase, partial [Gammaproteobacteria bacterium]
DLYAHPERPITPEEAQRTLDLIARRAAGEPVVYLTGEREFYGLAFTVTPAVLIPRPETELLVDLALERLPAEKASRVLDLGTGSGAIAIAIAHARPHACVFAVDRSAEALAVARGNAQRHNLDNLTFIHSDWLAPFADERFDLIVSNPPYVAAADPHLDQGDLRFEPKLALPSGVDGLDDLRRIIATAPNYLHNGGWLLLEHGADQQPAVLDLLAAQAFTQCTGHRDLANLPRAVSAQRQ